MSPRPDSLRRLAVNREMEATVWASAYASAFVAITARLAEALDATLPAALETGALPAVSKAARVVADHALKGWHARVTG